MYLIIEKTLQGWRIKDTLSGATGHYVGYSLREAEKKHRQNMNIRYKHFDRIYLGCKSF